MKRILAFASALIVTFNSAIGADCGMSVDFRQPDDEGSASIAVYGDSSTSALLFADAMKVNTDGTLRSYSVDDFWGERDALNNLCNASSDKCGGLTSDQMRERRIFVQKVKSQGWPLSEIPKTKIDKDIIPFRNGQPCPEKDGFLISATALHKKNITDECDIGNYVDSLKVSAIVLPRGIKLPNQLRQKSEFQKRGAEMGDLAVSVTADFSVVSYSVVGDMGPAKELGEVSIALAKVLLKKEFLPKNYLEVRGRGEFRGKGWNPGRTFVLVFPRSRDDNDPFLTQDRIDSSASAAFAKWGGMDRLKECASEYRR